jgi:hypothetical protein
VAGSESRQATKISPEKKIKEKILDFQFAEMGILPWGLVASHTPWKSYMEIYETKYFAQF